MNSYLEDFNCAYKEQTERVNEARTRLFEAFDDFNDAREGLVRLNEDINAVMSKLNDINCNVEIALERIDDFDDVFAEINTIPRDCRVEEFVGRCACCGKELTSKDAVSTSQGWCCRDCANK